MFSMNDYTFVDICIYLYIYMYIFWVHGGKTMYNLGITNVRFRVKVRVKIFSVVMQSMAAESVNLASLVRCTLEISAAH